MIGILHGSDILRSDLVAVSHQVGLGPFRQRMSTGMKEDIGDQSCMSSIPIPEGMDLGQSILKPCGDF